MARKLPDQTDNQVRTILLVTTLLNLVSPLFMAWSIFPGFAGTFRLTGALGLLVFVSLHGWHRYGWTPMLVFFGLSFGITWSTETLSIATGFPFGHYAYTDLLGDKLGQVPLMIMPAYFFVGYLAWTMGGMLLDETGNPLPRDTRKTISWLKTGDNVWRKKRNIVLVPLVASALMVFWNASFDPIMSTIEGNWIWRDGGAYFGVPLSNFFGWFITVYLIFQSFALYLAIFSRTNSKAAGLAVSPAGSQDNTTWMLMPLMYIGQGLPYFLYAFFQKEHENWQIYRSMSAVTVATMFLAAAICLVVYGARRKSRQMKLDAPNPGESQALA